MFQKIKTRVDFNRSRKCTSLNKQLKNCVIRENETQAVRTYPGYFERINHRPRGQRNPLNVLCVCLFKAVDFLTTGIGT